MAFNAPVAFFSYAHGDDANESGAILELAAHLQDECRLLLGRDDFEMFVDRTSISWGDLWQRRIADALSESTFLVPIVTPRYFCRGACTDELHEFSEAAKRADDSATKDSLQRSIMPILYVPVDDLEVSSKNEDKAFIASIQYEDWTRNRLTRPSSHPYRVGINKLAFRLVRHLNQCRPAVATHPTKP